MSTRTARISAFVLGIAIALGLLAWYLRDTLIREISNPLLDEYGIEVTDVSLDALATRDASIAYLELTYEEDTVIAIDGLTLPIVGTQTGTKTYTARRVSVAMPGDGEESLELAPVVEQVLSLSEELAGSEFLIAELRLPPYPTVYDLRWSLKNGEQVLDARVGEHSMSARVRRTSATAHAVEFSIPAGRILAGLERDDSGFSLSGSSELELPAWSPLAKLAGIVPREIGVDSGKGRLALDVDIPFGTATLPTAQVELEPTSPVQLAYTHDSGEITSVELQTGSPVLIAAEFPEVDWTLQQAHSVLLVSYDDWKDIPLALSDIVCKPGPECSMSARVDMANSTLPIGTVGETSLSALIDVVFTDDAVELDLRPGAAFNARQVESPDFEVTQIEGRLVSSGTLQIVDAGWTFAADSIDANVAGLRATDDVAVAMPVFLEDVSISELDEALSVTSSCFVPGVEAQWRELGVDLPGFKGQAGLDGDVLQAELETMGLQQNGSLQLNYNLQTGAGVLLLDDTIVSLNAKALSDRVSPWDAPWDLRDGSIAASLSAEWRGSGDVLHGNLSTVVSSLSGYYEDSVFADVSTALEIAYSADGEMMVAPARVTVGLIDVGLPITDISADYELDPANARVNVDNLRMSALGGEIRADPFSFHTAEGRNTLLLHAESMQMDELLTVREFEAIEVTGSISARLPVSIEGDAITIENGTLSGEPPGGVIRYLPGTPPDESDVSSLAFVRKVLSNFEYESLESVVDYTRGGDLKLQLRLEGRNPDMEETRPVVLNLDVENNVPQMLRSLRATRAVEEVLEQRFLQQRDNGK